MIGRGFQEFFFGPSLLAKVIQNNRRKDKQIAIDRIAYGEHSQQYMLFFYPQTDNYRGKMIFFIHGGAWRVGSPELFRFIGLFFARLGFITVLPGYRLAPRFRFPAQLDDTADALVAAVDWVKKQGLPFEKVVLGGYSAGAQLVALIAYHPQESLLRRFDRAMIAGLILVSGPVNFEVCRRNIMKLAIFDYLGSIFGWRKADPIRYVTGQENIPVLCIHGQDDPLVGIENSITFTAKINSYRENLAELIPVESACHADLLRLFWGELEEVHQLIAWLDRIAPQRESALKESAATSEYLEESQNHEDQTAQHAQKVCIPTPVRQITNAATQRGA